MTKDYRLEVRIRNNPLLVAMQEEGVKNASELARRAQVTPQTVGQYLNLKRVPIDENGNWGERFLRIATALHRLPEDLIPSQHLHTVLKKNTGSMELDGSDIPRLLEFSGLKRALPPNVLVEEKELKTAVAGLLKHLTPDEEFTIRARFGFDGPEKTHEEIASILGVSQARTRQLQANALKRMGRPFSCNLLKPVVSGSLLDKLRKRKQEDSEEGT